MNQFIKVKSLINLPDSRSDMKKDQIGKTASLQPHSFRQDSLLGLQQQGSKQIGHF